MVVYATHRPGGGTHRRTSNEVTTEPAVKTATIDPRVLSHGRNREWSPLEGADPRRRERRRARNHHEPEGDRPNELPSITHVIGRMRIPPITPPVGENTEGSAAHVPALPLTLVRLIVVSTS